MDKLFVYLNIPWEFIKQRPQFLSEKLGRYIEVLVYYNKPYKSTYIVKRNNNKENISKIAQIKLPRKNKLLRDLDNKLQRFFLKKYLKEYNLIEVMHPEQYEIIKPLISSKKLIYDCMDDYSQFPHLSSYEAIRLQEIERDLVSRADCIFYTSKTLKDNLIKRYDIKTNGYVVNNALEPEESYQQDQDIQTYMNDIVGKKIVYIGAIAPWFDFELVERILEADKKVNVVLFGPADIPIPELERLYHYGKIQHDSIYTAMKCADILIMPFKINELILAVDPIKVYEYIYSGKQVIVPYYAEMDKFKEYVNIYHNLEEALTIIQNLNQGNSPEQIREFVKNNTWEARARQIAQILRIDEK